eukprot:NODE_392_length_8143_cov_0.403282.p6 type:complete len:208 gc:universal NODE_392_length_8143_cov_0.403282:1457-834(-)
MIFVLPLSAINQNEDDYVPIHNQFVCKIKGFAIQCGGRYKSVRYCDKSGQNCEMEDESGSDINQASPASIDFYGSNSICIARNDGMLYCGNQPSLSVGAYTLNEMDGADITHIRLSQDYPYMCLRNWNSQVWCVSTDHPGHGTFSASYQWTRVISDGITNKDFGFEQDYICGTKKDDSTRYCVQLGTSFDPTKTYAIVTNPKFPPVN